MGGKSKINILMVDDEPGKLLSYQVMLGELGENLIKASSGSQAFELLLKTDVAVILMDVSMPEVNGFELADVIHPSTSILAFTNSRGISGGVAGCFLRCGSRILRGFWEGKGARERAFCRLCW